MRVRVERNEGAGLRVEARRPSQIFEWHDELAETAVAGGPRGQLSTEEVIELLASLPARRPSIKKQRLSRASCVLDWLCSFPGEGWQDRWFASGMESNPARIDELIGVDDSRPEADQRARLMSVLYGLMMLRIIFPGYDFLSRRGVHGLCIHCRKTHREDLFARLEERAEELGISSVQHRAEAIGTLTKIVVRTGRDLDQLGAEDLFAYRAWYKKRRNKTAEGVSLAWRLLSGIADLGEHATLEEAARQGQRTPAQIVDFHGVQAPTVRRVLIRYLEERRPALDYSR